MEFFSVMAQIWSKYSHLFLHGLWMTVYMGLMTVAISTVTGSILALLRRSSFKPLQWLVTAYVEIIRGTPILLQLYFFYFMLPSWLPFLELSEFACVLIACCVNSTAYVCEIVRAGIEAVPKGQLEAAYSLGIRPVNAMRYVILPQALKNILPALGNEFITIIKDSSLLQTIGVMELWNGAQSVVTATYLPITPLLFVAFYYLMVTTVMSFLVKRLEKRMGNGGNN